jgi:chromate transporter
MNKRLNLFLTMLKIGLFTFGGGYAMIALLENEFVSNKKWIDKDEFLDMVAIAESTPGPIAINAATYIGYKTFGILGSLLATVAVCIPSFVIIYVISLLFDAFLSFSPVANAFRGIQVCVIYLILSSGKKMLKQMKKTAFNIGILSAVILCMVTFSIFSVSFSSILYILISGCLGLAVYLCGLLRGRKEADK